jgi:hypothetical protein
VLLDDIAAEARTLIDAEHAGHATDDTANDAADHGADGTGGSLTVARTALDATGNPLRLRHNGQRNGGDKGSNSDKTADHDSSNDVG